ncbi:curli production assembly protein CsgG [Alloacidobacterium dinghuense]|uniref:Curli production assembly protein CsgG n=1 Tax=Alloacidobacterium dinghuense TaxID=2763107 RepID=A0A7G8BML4_9BACT|nr:CsgG/HfaB family protein [Alloacidobacterium dinghuense]QNI33784.1 curli production assembly protein CsgG [Alloacidobacterium dinghuense]
MRTVVSALFTFLVMGSTVVAQQPVKHKVAVLDFNYATVMSASQAIFGTNVDIGKGISDMLINELVNDGTYRVIERNQIDKILNEQNFSNSNRADSATAAKIGHVLGVDAVITGDITQFGRDDQNKNIGGMLGKWGSGYGLGGVGTSKSKAEVAITARMIDVNTGEILASASGKGESARSGAMLSGGGAGTGGFGGGGAGMGSSNFAQTIIGEATTKAVTDLATNLNADSAKLPTIVAPTVSVNGLIADASAPDSVIVNVGTSAGLKVGDKLAVSRVVRVVKDPATGKPLRSIENAVGQLTITSVDASSAVGTFSGSGKPQTGDTVKTP